MEERIVDDEYGRGVRLKKTKDGYVDVTEEGTQPDAESVEEEVETADEIAFQFPVFETEEETEDYAELSIEDALKLYKEKEEAQARQKAEYEKACKEGEAFLKTGSFKSAEMKFEKAIALDKQATQATVGYWTAKTQNFENADLFIEEFLPVMDEANDYLALETIKRQHQETFKKRLLEIEKESVVLEKTVEEKKQNRQGFLKNKVKKSAIFFIATLIPFVAFLLLTIFFGLKNFTTKEGEYIVWTIVFGVLLFIFFIAFVLCANQLGNSLKMLASNKKLSATEEGRKLLKLYRLKAEYERLILDASIKGNH